MITKYNYQIIKNSSLICAALLLLGIFNLPIIFYTVLRVVVMTGAFAVIINRSRNKEYLWCIAFAIIAMLFNPIIPLYLYQSSKWFLFDALIAILFLIDYCTPNQIKPLDVQKKQRTYQRDKVY